MAYVLFAPMEGMTDAAFRRAHYRCFSGVESYYIPFISPTKHLVLTGREKHNVLPEYNGEVPCVPQILTRDEEHFLWAASLLAEMGYTEVNLNAGCPSGTVTAKGKGAGILRDVKELGYFLEDICTHSPLPVSVKTRIGFGSPEEWEQLLNMYAQYPLKRLIIHPRTCRERYAPGTIHRECWQMAREIYHGEMVFNGDLFSKEDIQSFQKDDPLLSGVMLGRGLVANPALARETLGGEPITKEEIVRFHAVLTDEMLKMYQPNIVFMKMRVVMKHLACCFDETKKLEKQIRKSRTLEELLAVDRQLFDTCELKEKPCFIPDELRKQELA